MPTKKGKARAEDLGSGMAGKAAAAAKKSNRQKKSRLDAIMAQMPAQRRNKK
jgi:hypothetical protein